MHVKFRSLCRLDAKEHPRVCFGSVAPVYDLSRLLSPESAENLSSYYDLPAYQDYPSMQVTRPKTTRRRATVLEKELKELCMKRSEMWEVMADLMQTVFGTPMFSQRPDRG